LYSLKELFSPETNKIFRKRNNKRKASIFLNSFYKIKKQREPIIGWGISIFNQISQLFPKTYFIQRETAT